MQRLKFLTAEMSEMPRTPETRRALSFSPQTILHRVMLADELVGYCGHYVAGPVFWLGSDYVLPAYRGQGLLRQTIR